MQPDRRVIMTMNATHLASEIDQVNERVTIVLNSSDYRFFPPSSLAKMPPKTTKLYLSKPHLI